MSTTALDSAILSLSRASAEAVAQEELLSAAKRAVEERELAFLTECMVALRRNVKPTFEAVAAKVESARRLGRYSSDDAAKKEVQADIEGDEQSASLILSRGGERLGSLAVSVDRKRLEARLTITFRGWVDGRFDGRAESLQPVALNDAKIELAAAELIAGVANPKSREGGA
jgi:hypothetical protein